MPDFVFAYHMDPNKSRPADGPAYMNRWMSWIGGLGDAVVNPGVPVGASKTVSDGGVADDGGPNPVCGFVIVNADDMDAALEMAKSCPHLEMGTIEVAEAMDMG